MRARSAPTSRPRATPASTCSSSAATRCYWRTRYEPSADSSHTAYRTLVSYKETWANAKIDPTAEWTGTWRDPRFAPPAQGAGRPENALTGTMYMVNFTDLAVTGQRRGGQATGCGATPRSPP